MTTTNYAVAPELAEFDVPTLMTKAFEITHRLDGLARYNGTAMGAAKIAEAREERDAIVREMTRRSDGFERAMTMVEAAERVMRGCDETLSGVGRWTTEDRVNAPVAEVREMLDRAMSRTTDLTCSLVKNQTISDRIAAGARDIVRAVVNR